MKRDIGPNEVRIGNMVFNTAGGKECEISPLDMVKLAEGEILTKCHNYQAIPLTERWLTKVGFKNIAPNKWSLCIAHWVIFIYKQNGFVFKINDAQISKQMDSVHDLQNLIYSLTGQELTPKNV